MFQNTDEKYYQKEFNFDFLEWSVDTIDEETRKEILSTEYKDE